MNPEPRVEGCREAVPGVCMSQDANYSQPRWWNLVRVRPLTDRRISDYMRRGYYREARLEGWRQYRQQAGVLVLSPPRIRYGASWLTATTPRGRPEPPGNGNLARKLRAHLTCGAF